MLKSRCFITPSKKDFKAYKIHSEKSSTYVIVWQNSGSPVKRESMGFVDANKAWMRPIETPAQSHVRERAKG